MIYDSIKEIAASKGISIYRIERDLNFSNGVISKWNESTPNVLSIQKVASYLDVSLDKILSEKDKKDTKEA